MNTKKTLLFFLAIVSITLFSCDKNNDSAKNELKNKEFTFSGNNVDNKTLSPKEYLNWIENPENGFIQEKTINEFTYLALFKPKSYLSLIDLGNIEVIDKKKFIATTESYTGMDYFTFKITCNQTNEELLRYKSGSQEEYFNRLEYFSFKAQNDFYILNGKDTSKCELLHFERSFGLAPILTFVLGFPEVKNKMEDKTLVFEDKIFKNGTVKLMFPKEMLDKEPSILLN